MQFSKNPNDVTDPVLASSQVLPLLQSLPSWGNLVTIVFSGGSVFEFKGPFPPGEMSGGYYNLEGPVPGLHGHLNVSRWASVRFQEKPHRGRASYAFVFEDEAGHAVFKVFLGRDDKGEILNEQLVRFEQIRSTLNVDS